MRSTSKAWLPSHPPGSGSSAVPCRTQARRARLTSSRKKVHPDSIRKVIKAYHAVRPNLLRISSQYPEARTLLDLVSESVAKYGMDGVGEEYDSDGSRLLISAVDRLDDSGRPLHVGLWGGANCLAQVCLVPSRPGLSCSMSHARRYGEFGTTGRRNVVQQKGSSAIDLQIRWKAGRIHQPHGCLRDQ